MVFQVERLTAHYGQNIISVKRLYITKRGRGQTVEVFKAAKVVGIYPGVNAGGPCMV